MRNVGYLLILIVIIIITSSIMRANAETNLCYLPSSDQLQVKSLRNKIDSRQTIINKLKNDNIKYSSEIQKNNILLSQLKQKEIYIRSNKNRDYKYNPNNRLTRNPLASYKIKIKQIQVTNLELKNKIKTNRILINSAQNEIQEAQVKLNIITNKSSNSPTVHTATTNS